MREHCLRAAITPSMLLCTVYAEMLRIYSSVKDFCINVPVFNCIPLQPDPEFILGDFTSSILLEVKNSSLSFEERAKYIQEQFAKDMDHVHFSGVRVLRELMKSKPSDSRASAMMPIVFTGLMDYDVKESWLGTVVEDSGLSETPQVFLGNEESVFCIDFCRFACVYCRRRNWS